MIQVDLPSPGEDPNWAPKLNAALNHMADEITPYGELIPRTPIDTLVPDDKTAAAANAAAIQKALDSSFGRVVHLPAGLFWITSIRIPKYKHLTGEYAHSYYDMPAEGTRLRCPSSSQTEPVVRTDSRSMISKIGIYGTNSTVEHSVVRLDGNGVVIRDVEIGYGKIGIDGNYHSAYLDNVHIFGTGSRAISDLVDGTVNFCTLNSNLGVGIYAGTGAGSSQYTGNRIEWNDGAGIVLFESHTNAFVGNIIDRNGKSGIRATFCQDLVIANNTFWRNGRYSEGVVADDNHLAINGGELVITGNSTKVGVNDDGVGYRSPANAVYVQGVPTGVVSGNDFTGTTGLSWRRLTGSDDSGLLRSNNKLRAGEIETFSGLSYVGEKTIDTLAGNSQGTVVIPLPGHPSFSPGHIYRVQIAARDHESSSNVAACVVDILVSRSLAADARVAGTLTNVVGTAFGLGAGNGFYQVSLSLSGAAGESLIVQVYNSSTAVRSFSVRVQ